MPSLIAYRKASDAITTHTLRLPMPQPEHQGQQTGQELATLPDGRTIVALFGAYDLPAGQPALIADSIEHLSLPLSSELRDQVLECAPSMRLIAKRLVEHIRAKYSVDDEAYFNRIAVGQLMGLYQMSASEQSLVQAYGARAEEARAIAKAARAAYGL